MQSSHEIIKPAMKQKKTDAGISFPDSPPPGFGNMTLGAVCSQYDLVIPTIIRGLKEINIKATPDNTIKEIAKENSKEPMAVFESLHALVKGDTKK